MVTARFYEDIGDGLQCRLCPHGCIIRDGKTGMCGVRRNCEGTLVSDFYGVVSSMALDPIEKKPLARFHPGSFILSIGGLGCNMRCSFCQNSAISQPRFGTSKTETEFLSPQQLLDTARSVPGNVGVAFTYNEPLIGIEYLLDAAPLLRSEGLETVLVTNGMVEPEPLRELLPHVSAMNIDVKAFTDGFYARMGGDLRTVKRSVEMCAPLCHVEVTTLVIPGENDGEEEIRALSVWLASVSRELPLHLTRFFPRHKMLDKAPTPTDTLYRLADVARRELEFVYVGNVP
ncbi:MAG: AmmeMemoRadiSam system radical SAM enzyme [Synergistaceae bacterium]|jgi:pyruvate formate lyase activating enzyme|nr:AmmeMemoRadiSam system radical SAM enzyme [Synergistaceae bacterium]